MKSSMKKFKWGILQLQYFSFFKMYDCFLLVFSFVCVCIIFLISLIYLPLFYCNSLSFLKNFEFGIICQVSYRSPFVWSQLPEIYFGSLIVLCFPNYMCSMYLCFGDCIFEEKTTFPVFMDWLNQGSIFTNNFG